MEFEDFAGFIMTASSLLILVPAALGLVVWRKSDTKSKALCLFLVGIGINNFITFFQALFYPVDNRYLSHVISVLVALYGYFGFQPGSENKRVRMASFFILIMIVTSVPYVIFTEGFRPYNYLSFGLACGYVSLSSIASLNTAYSHRPFFFVVAGASIYFAITCLFFSFYEYYVIRGLLDQLRLLYLVIGLSSVLCFYIPSTLHFLDIKKRINV